LLIKSLSLLVKSLVEVSIGVRYHIFEEGKGSKGCALSFVRLEYIKDWILAELELFIG